MQNPGRVGTRDQAGEWCNSMDGARLDSELEQQRREEKSWQAGSRIGRGAMVMFF